MINCFLERGRIEWGPKWNSWFFTGSPILFWFFNAYMFQHVPVLSNGFSIPLMLQLNHFPAFPCISCIAASTYRYFFLKLSDSFELHPFYIPRFCSWSSFHCGPKSWTSSSSHTHGSEETSPVLFLPHCEQKIADPLSTSMIIWRKNPLCPDYFTNMSHVWKDTRLYSECTHNKNWSSKFQLASFKMEVW